ncbi:ABC-type dipeptide transport system, periplasmic component [Desulfosporosinus orientis DSM 765]|uniref:ABC-type dipeptide transport system, periplasmic component n=1 Tax=Desulfosporosinus orientis (strain ATCC 19365 / DSM 765 / NCIMB 8382 / VKM B-1628 / Singapore I) TaxID=768706 RepID=G7WEJ3_DESOD|nr:ABC transporter substrate-binding protein [Desulfosporosinus orientis]AET70806.1 ABC-type dipeptide transport system, periplasmic component [Desulfosporosinus orientis DSM 765]
MRKVKKIMALALSAALVVVSLAGCGSEANTENTAPKASDTLIYAQGSEPRGLDPALVDDGESAKVMSNIYEGLLKYNKDSTKVEPSLAKSWDVSPDGLTYTFHLQEGVKFQDGTDFNAEAVKFNIDRQLPPQVTEDMAYAPFVYGSVKDVEVVDTNTVKINLKAPSTPFLNNLAMIMAAPMISPKALKDNNNNVNQAPVGTGPYKFVKWEKDQNIVLVRNDDYWGTKANIKNVIFKFIKDNSARVVALNNGEADIIDGIDSTVVKQITDAGNKIFQAPGMNINYMAYNTSRKPFNDQKVRVAVSQAINVPELVESLYQGYSEPATSILPSFMEGYDKSISQVAYDPTAAAKTLKDAGITSLHMITYTNPRPYNAATGQSLAEAIQGYLSKVGVQVTIDSFDWTTYKQKLKAGDYDLAFYGWIGDNGDPDNFLYLLSVDDPTMNIALYKNDEFNSLIAKGLTTPAGDDRNAIYTQLEKIAADDAAWLPISHAQTLCAYQPNVENFYFHMTGITPFAGVVKK